jgi:hypothetical protein
VLFPPPNDLATKISPAHNNNVVDQKNNPMKNFQHFEKRELESIDIGFDASSSGKLSDRIRNYCLHILIFMLTCHAVFGEIKNGYEKNISGTKQSLAILRAKLLDEENMTSGQRRKIQSTIATLVDHVAYYDLTEGLLRQFKTIAPELFAQVDTIRDRLGRPVDVYIKFVPADATSVKAWGLTYMDQSSDDKDAYQSEYGKFTVSIKVWIVRRSLLVLAHELGHVKYQVPNLANYLEFHKQRYTNMPARISMGHDIDDPSGKWASQFGKTFQKKYSEFLKISIEKVQNPLDVLVRLKKNWSKNAALLYKISTPIQRMEIQPTPCVASTTELTCARIKPRSTGKSMFSLMNTGDNVVSGL